MSLVYATFWSIVTILKEPVLLLCLLLTSKGWCITRHLLERREVTISDRTTGGLARVNLSAGR